MIHTMYIMMILFFDDLRKRLYVLVFFYKTKCYNISKFNKAILYMSIPNFTQVRIILFLIIMSPHFLDTYCFCLRRLSVRPVVCPSALILSGFHR
jgi:hypothetical protein